MPGQADLPGGDGVGQGVLLFHDLVEGVLGGPLEGGEGLGNEGGNRDGDVDRLALGLGGEGVVKVHYPLAQGGDAQDVLHGFKGQAQHEVEFDAGVAPLEGDAGGAHDFFLSDALVDDVPEALGSGLGGEGQAAFPDLADLIQQFFGEVVHPEGGEGEVDVLLLGVVDDLIQHFFHLGVVGGGEGGQGHFLIAGGVAEGLALGAEGVGALGPDGAVDEPRLTEAAAPDAAPHDLQHRPVVDHLGVGDDEGVGIKDLVEVPDDALGDFGGSAVFGGDGGDGAVLMIGHVVKGGDVHAGDLGGVLQKSLFVPFAGGAVLLVEVDHFQHDLLALAQLEAVEEVAERLGVHGAGAAGEDDGVVVGAVLRQGVDARQVQHVEDVGVGKLVLQRKSQEVELF